MQILNTAGNTFISLLRSMKQDLAISGFVHGNRKMGCIR